MIGSTWTARPRSLGLKLRIAAGKLGIWRAKDRLRRFASTTPTVYQRTKRYLYPRDIERVGAFVKFGHEEREMNAAAEDMERAYVLDFAEMGFKLEIEQIIRRLALRRSWPIDQRRILVPSSISVYLKTGLGHDNPLNVWSTLAWSATTISAKIAPMTPNHFLRRTIDDTVDARLALSKEIARVREAIR